MSQEHEPLPDDGEEGTDASPRLEYRSRDPKIGLELLEGRFQVTELIARGGMGAVYRAKSRDMANDVAVKFLETGRHLDHQEMKRRFVVEMDILSELQDVRIPRVLAKGETPDGKLFMVTEYLEGRTLQDELKREKRLPSRRVVEVMMEVCLALSEAHARNIIHRDIKPANLFIQKIVGGVDQIRVLDFGIAKVTKEGVEMTTMTPDGHTPRFGTFTYMSPEQANAIPVVHQSDLYSLGVVAYHCLTGQPPFSGSPSALLDAHRKAAPRPFSEVAPDLVVDPALEQLVMKLLAKSPEERPESARVVYEALRRLPIAEAGETVKRPSPPPSTAPGSPWLFWIAAGVATFAVAIVVFLVIQRILPPSTTDDPTTTAAAAVAPAPPDEPPDEPREEAPSVPPAPTTGTVRFEVTPPGARVLIDGDALADPSGSTVRAAKRYTALVRADGYLDRETSFEVVPGRETVVEVALRRRPRFKVELTSFEPSPTIDASKNSAANKRVRQAAIACYEQHFPKGTERVEFFVDVSGGPPAARYKKSATFADCLSEKTKDVRYSVKGIGFIQATVERKALK